jgi:hypothetical protein
MFNPNKTKTVYNSTEVTKYLGINVTKEGKDWYTEGYSLKEIKGTDKWKAVPDSQTGRLTKDVMTTQSNL